jgi:hypothetical protein
MLERVAVRLKRLHSCLSAQNGAESDYHIVIALAAVSGNKLCAAGATAVGSAATHTRGV